MRKILLTVLLLTIGCASFAQCETTCAPAYDLTSKTSRFFSTVTGQNFLAEKIANSLLKKVIKKNIDNGKVSAKIDSYSVRDLKAGKFKSLQITAKDIETQGVYLSYISLKTLCDFNYIVSTSNKDVIIKEDIPMSVTAVITEDNLNQTMNSADYKRMLNDINSIANGLFEITSTKVKIKNDRLYYDIKYNFPFVRKSKDFVLVSDLCVNNGKIALANTSFVTNNSSMELNKISRLLNYINPLDFSAKILENKDAKFNIQNVTIKDGKIAIDGTMTLLKDKE